MGTDVTTGAREPNEAAACVHDERQGLRRSSKAEGDSVATIAVGIKWSLEKRRAGVSFRFGFGFGFVVGVF